jgi:hypothetical protein
MRYQQTDRVKQTIPRSEKLGKKGEDWRISNVNYVGDTNGKKSEQSYIGLYKMAAGYLDESKYKYATDPHHTNRKFHSKLRNYDIISPIVQMLMGEKSKRKSDPIVIAINSDIVNVKEIELKNLINRELDQLVINKLNEITETGYLSRDIRGQEELQTQVDSIKDDKAITGQESLQYIFYEQDVRRKLRESFNDMIITAHAVTKKDVQDNNVVYENYSPENTGYTCSENTRFIEDGESAWIRDWKTISDIIDDFYDELTDEEVKRLEEIGKGQHSSIDSNVIDSQELIRSLREDGKMNVERFDDNLTNKNGLHEVLYVNWKSKVKVGKVTGLDIFGEPYEGYVTEDFKPRPDEKVEWRWVNETWEGYRIADEIFLRIRPVPYQRGTFDNPSKCKLLINGMTLHGRHYYTKSPVEKLEPYQEKFNVIHWHLEKVMNKNKDKLVFLPKGVIPDDEDMDMFDMMHFAESDGFLFGNEVDTRRLNELNAIKVLDLSLKDYLQQLYELLQFIRSEAEETLGITRQRKGQNFASDGKATTEQSIFQSAIISEEIFLEFEEFEEKEYQGLLDLSKYAWRKGKKATFVDSDKRKVMLNVLGEEYTELEFGVTVVNGKEQQEKLNRIRANSQAWIQNSSKQSLVLKMENTENIEELIDILALEEEKLEQQQQAAQQAEIDVENAKIEQVERHHADKMQLEVYKIDTDLQKAQLTGASIDQTLENDIKYRDIQIKQEKNQIDREKIQASIQISREKNATALKNKVVGESK